MTASSLAGLAGLGGKGAGGDKGGGAVPSLRMSLTLAHQSRIRSMYCSRQSLASQDNSSPASEMGCTPVGASGMNASRPDSSSSTTSSVTDWESGLSTVRRQQQAPPQTNTSMAAAKSARKVEDISAFNESRLRSAGNSTAMTKALSELHPTLHADSRSRSRFVKTKTNVLAMSNEDDIGQPVASGNKSARSGSLDTLDRLVLIT